MKRSFVVKETVQATALSHASKIQPTQYKKFKCFCSVLLSSVPYCFPYHPTRLKN